MTMFTDGLEAATGDPNNFYPTQSKHDTDILFVSVEEMEAEFYFPEKKTLIFPKGSFYVEDAQVRTKGYWYKIDTHRTPASAKQAESFSVSNWIEDTMSVAHEASVGFSASATAAAKPFGIGAEITIEASIGYAITIANDHSKGMSSDSGAMVEPGYQCDAWGRRVHLTARANVGNISKIELYKMWKKQNFPNGFSAGVAPLVKFDESNKEERIYEEFCKLYGKRLEADYTLPLKEIYYVQYPISA